MVVLEKRGLSDGTFGECARFASTDSSRLVQAAVQVEEAVGDAILRGPRLSCTLDR